MVKVLSRKFNKLSILLFTNIIFIILLSLPIKHSLSSSSLPYVGVNLSGAEFTPMSIPGVYGYDYIYPSTDEMQYFFDQGATSIRIPLLWERIQRELYSPLNKQEISRLDLIVKYITERKKHLIIDLHNYARYKGKLIGEKNVPLKAFSDLWRRFARRYGKNPNVIFGIMNEPHGMTTEQWLKAANTALYAIRQAGATNLVLVPGNAWSGAHSWEADWYGTPNALVMPRLIDPLRKFAFEVHQYFDINYSGTSGDCSGANEAINGIKKMTNWLRRNNHRSFLGEIGVGTSQSCLDSLNIVLQHLNDNSDVWIGWTYWAGGPWWSNSYPFNVSPLTGVTHPQINILRANMQAR